MAQPNMFLLLAVRAMHALCGENGESKAEVPRNRLANVSIGMPERGDENSENGRRYF